MRPDWWRGQVQILCQHAEDKGGWEVRVAIETGGDPQPA